MKVLKDLVTNKIIIRKQDNKRQREEDVKNINFIRKFYNISMDTQERIKSEESYFDKKN